MRLADCRGTVWFTVLAAVLAGLLTAAPETWAQEAVTVQVVQVDRSRFPEIDVYVSVTDADGRPVKDLGPEDFRLVENGAPVPLTHVSRAGEQGPVTAVLLIDRSGSMNYAGKMEAAREAAVAFVELMRPGDTTGVIAFNTEVTTVQPLTGDHELLVEAITGIAAEGDTALYDALHAASAVLEPVSGRKAVIVVTDGMNTAGERTREETLALMSQGGVSIYTIGLGDPSLGTGAYAGIDEPTLQAIAEDSGGVYTFAPDPQDLRGLYELLSLRIQNEYRLTYRSPNPLRDGTNRTVTVTLAAASGSTQVSATYNPGGVIPEVESRSTWGLFGAIFAVLVLLLVLPGTVGWVAAAASRRRTAPGKAGAGAKEKAKGRVGSAKGRIRLTDGGRPSGKRRR